VTFLREPGQGSYAEAVRPSTAATASSSARPFFRRPLALAAAGVVVALTAGGAVAASAHKNVEIDLNGEIRTVSTFAGSVDGALRQAGIEVAARDEVTPGLQTAIGDGDEIVVRQAHSIEISVDGRTQTLWTTAPTAGEALADILASGRDASIVASRSTGGARTALELPVVSAGTVTVVADGATSTLQVDGPTLARDLLDEAAVTLGDLDRVLVTRSADGTVTVTVNRVVRGERVETEAIAHTTREQADATLYKGERRVIQAGADGTIERTLSTLTVDGVETYAALKSETTTAQPVEEVVAVGTKARPTTAPSGVWGALAQCESGGNPAARSANGLYYGLYQFSLGTWAAVGGSGLPSNASVAEQTLRAQILQARSGWGQWPHCAAKLGLI
jgi:uncharacterized protein YabE (DUF348 family)